MKQTNKLIALLLAVALLLAIPATGVYAQETITVIDEVSYANPLLDATAPTATSPNTVRASSTYYTTIEEAGESIRADLVVREGTVTVKYMSSDSDYATLAREIIYAAMEHTGNSYEGDALLWDFKGYNCSIGVTDTNPPDGVYHYTFSYAVTYYSTAELEEELREAIPEVLDSLNLTGMSDYMKILTVYQYICDNVTYDYTNLYDDDYTLKYTAYAALFNGTAVCQGYSTLFYRMMLELGIDARVIAGISNGGSHGWNIVKIGDYYYDLDTTWDAGKSFSNYKYFLTTESTFSVTHVRNDEYDTEEFNTAYPMSDSDYTPTASDYEITEDDDTSSDTSSDDTSSDTSSDDTSSDTSSEDTSSDASSEDTSSDDTSSEEVGVTVTQSSDDTVVVSGTGTLTEEDLAEVENPEAVTLIVIGSGITAIDADALADFTALTAVILPTSVTEIDEAALGTLTDVTIYGYKNSYAQEFAAENDYTFGLIGDAYTDGKLTTADALTVMKYAVHSLDPSTLSAAEFYVVDYSGDGSITTSDALAVLSAAVS